MASIRRPTVRGCRRKAFNVPALREHEVVLNDGTTPVVTDSNVPVVTNGG